MAKMTKARALELLPVLRSGKAVDISLAWQARLIEALEFVVEKSNNPYFDLCPICGEARLEILFNPVTNSKYKRCPNCSYSIYGEESRKD